MRTAIIVVFFSLLSSLISPAAGQSFDDHILRLQQKIDKLDKQINSVADDLNGMKNSINTLNSAVKKIEERISKGDIALMIKTSLTKVLSGKCIVPAEKLTREKGEGPRTHTCPIIFSSPFTSPPTMIANISQINLTGDGVRLHVDTSNITETQAEVTINTWGASNVHGAEAAWIAIGK